MKIQRKHICSTMLVFAISTLFLGITEGSGDGSGSGSGDGDDPWNYYGGDDNFYAFSEYGDAAMHWSDYSIKPEACINRGGSDIIIFSMYSVGNNECSKKTLGNFHVTVAQYVKAISKDNEKAAELSGDDYDDPNALNYLGCQAMSDDDGQTIYANLGCKSGAWKALAVNAFSDQYCTEALESYSFQIDLSETILNFGTCQSCASWTIPNDDGIDDLFASEVEYFSPLCSAVWNYREICDGSCQRQMKITTGAMKVRKFTGGQKVMLFLLSTLGIFSMMGVLVVRRKMSKEDALLEDAQVERIGIGKDQLPKVFLAFLGFIIILMLFRVKGLTFFFLIAVDIFLLGYWARLEYRQKGRIRVFGIHLYGDKDDIEDDDQNYVESTMT